MNSATYSPEDDKLRVYPAARLDQQTYERVRAKGYRWAPHQELFFAVWTPEAEDIALELAEGAIDDEDKSLRERAEERADRFEEYSTSRAEDAEAASAEVYRICDLTQGQPILIGHHSEKRHRKDLSRMDAKASEAVAMWKTSEYWTRRAAAAIAHAKYKERPDVRARRIKGLEAEERKFSAEITETDMRRERWEALPEDPSREDALKLANISATYTAWSDLEANRRTPTEVRASVIAGSKRYALRCWRWLSHTRNRLAYERAMLAASGGIETDKSRPEVGGGVRCWASPGRFNSCRGYSWVKKVNKVSVTIEDNWGNGNPQNFTRTIPFDKCSAVISREDVERARAAGRLCENSTRTGFYITEAPTEEASQ